MRVMVSVRLPLPVMFFIAAAILLSEAASVRLPRFGRKEVIACENDPEVTLFGRENDDVKLISVRLDFGGRRVNRGLDVDDSRFQGRLEIDSLGAVHLRNVDLNDHGLYHVSWGNVHGESESRDVILHVAEPASVDSLYVRKEVSGISGIPGDDHVTLVCGGIRKQGFPPVSVLWTDPDGRTLLSTRQTEEGTFQLDLPRSSPSGKYSCSLHCQAWSGNCCPKLPPASIDVSIKPEMTSCDVTGYDEREREIGQSVSALIQQHLGNCSEQWKSLSEMVDALQKNLTDLSSRLEKTDCFLGPDAAASQTKGGKAICYGLKGDKGHSGLPGRNGLPGLRGVKGERGHPGVRGMKGQRGDFGIKGDPGLPGRKGDHGPRGLKGMKGEMGDSRRISSSCLAVSGSTLMKKGTVLCYGVKGDPGIPGPKGDRGLSGSKGSPGMPGRKGEQGNRGFRGRSGRNKGRPGAKGERGFTGPRGRKGEPGPCCDMALASPPPGDYLHRTV